MDSTLSRALALTALALPTLWAVAQVPATMSENRAPAAQAPANKATTATAQGTKGTGTPPKQGTTTAVPAKGGATVVRGPGVRRTPPAPAKPVWEQFKLDPKSTLFLDFTESSADAVLSIFSRTSGITILRDPSFKSPLTVTSAKAVPLKEAFEILNTVLTLQGYQLQKRGNLLLVGRIPPPQRQEVAMAAPPPPPQPEVKTYLIQNADATAVAKVLNDVFGSAAGGGGGNPGGGARAGGMMIVDGAPQPMGGGAPGGGGGGTFKATSESYTNAVIVKALPVDQAKAKALIDELDKKTAQPLESEVFKLEYIPVDQAVSAIDDILTANSPTGRGARSNSNQNQNYSFFYNPFGGGSSPKSAGAQSVTAIKQSNSVVVNATKENMALIRKLVATLDQESLFVGTTSVIRLENAKATDVADLLTKLFTPQRNPNDNGGFFFFDAFGGGGNNNQKSAYSTDTDEAGRIVNVRDIAGKVNVQADPNTNSLVIQTQPGNMRMIRPIIEKLDVRAPQVMIETVIVEANLTQTDKLGVEYGTLGSVLNGGDTGSGSIDFGLGKATDLQGLKYTIGNPDYKIFLNAVQSDSRFKVLDTPRIFTSNNAKAVVNVGQQYPYVSNSNVGALGNVINTYTFLDIAVNLTVTPRITSNGQVTMEVVQTANDLQGFTNYANATAQAPIINNRSASTTVSVDDGQTIVLGGIIRQTTTDSKTKVPLLGDLPFLGALFRSTVKTKGQTELLVFLTPHVVRNRDDADTLRKTQTGELTRPSQDDLKGKVPPVKTKQP